MKAVLQRANQASVTVDEKVVGSIGRGLLLLVGFGPEDSSVTLQPFAEKIVNLRIFPDEKGRFHYSVLDIQGGILVVPNFTLYADCSKGRRPDFFGALPPEQASILFEELISKFTALGIKDVARGIFGAHMQIALENDGPVTLIF